MSSDGLSESPGGTFVSPRGSQHTSVLVKEVVDHLRCRPDGIYLDATLGEGGHAEAILRVSAPSGRLVGLDRDREAVEAARERLSEYRNRTILVREHFARMADVLTRHHLPRVDGIIFDLGVSSRQLLAADRGFSFQLDGPLDMRMDRDQPLTAERLIQRLPKKEMADIIFRYGQERWAKRIANAIEHARRKQPIKTTRQLVEIILRAVPHGRSASRLHPATRTFQALRIAVNQELDHLEAALEEACRFLNRSGRLCVIAFHSLEDRIVKQVFRRLSGYGVVHGTGQGAGALIRVLTPKPLRPSLAEVQANPRSRSARLRVAERIDG
jgi:16S rRNA (cytosine1402-N4)-methyltransferase